MRKYKRQAEQAKEKAANREKMSLEAQLPLSELIAGWSDFWADRSLLADGAKGVRRSEDAGAVVRG